MYKPNYNTKEDKDAYKRQIKRKGNNTAIRRNRATKRIDEEGMDDDTYSFLRRGGKKRKY